MIEPKNPFRDEDKVLVYDGGKVIEVELALKYDGESITATVIA